jgi:hypothetical protein
MVVLRPGGHCASRGCPEARVLCSAESAPLGHSFVAIVDPYPHPQKILTVFDSQGRMRMPDLGPPHVADLLELERGMPSGAS